LSRRENIGRGWVPFKQYSVDSCHAGSNGSSNLDASKGAIERGMILDISLDIPDGNTIRDESLWRQQDLDNHNLFSVALRRSIS
jgi:hypothetical protein